jgi:hypothetical protein
MAHQKSYMPLQDSEFIAWAKVIFDTCMEHHELWELPPTILGQFETLLEDAEDKYQANSNKEARNKLSVIDKNTAFAALKSFLSTFINALEGNTLIPDSDIDKMGLRPRHQHAHQPTPPPTTAPVLTAIVGQHHDIDAYVSSLQHGHPTQYLKDGNYYGFLLKYRLEDETEWKTVLSTKLHYRLIFTEQEEGKHILMQAAWINSRLQNGPWSEEIRELIN